MAGILAKVIDKLGLNIDEMLVIAHTLFAFVRGYAAGEIAEREAQKNSPLKPTRMDRHPGHYTSAIVESGEFPMVLPRRKGRKRPLMIRGWRRKVLFRASITFSTDLPSASQVGL